MAIVKATYTTSGRAARAAIRYIQHRPGRDGERISRQLFNSDGALTRQQAYALITQAGQGSLFFRFAISPDPIREDTGKDLFLRDIAEQTMLTLEERLGRHVPYVAAEHDDHAPHRHVHILACVKGRLGKEDLAALRESATTAALFQRRERDLAREQQYEQQEGVGLELAR